MRTTINNITQEPGEEDGEWCYGHNNGAAGLMRAKFPRSQAAKSQSLARQVAGRKATKVAGIPGLVSFGLTR